MAVKAAWFEFCIAVRGKLCDNVDFTIVFFLIVMPLSIQFTVSELDEV